LVQIRPFTAADACRRIGLVWRHRYPREQTVRGLAELILANLPPGVEAARA
jgi:hypothetical protein